jgi:hypothetical protein
MPNLVYRWRPNGLDHESCLMEIMILRPMGEQQAQQRPAPYRLLKETESWAHADELGGLGAIVDQDMGNMPFVQQGLRAAIGKTIQVGRYSESRIRAHHKTLAVYVGS